MDSSWRAQLENEENQRHQYRAVLLNYAIDLKAEVLQFAEPDSQAN